MHKRDTTDTVCVGGSWLGDGIGFSHQLLKCLMEPIWFEIIKNSNILISPHTTEPMNAIQNRSFIGIYGLSQDR